MKSNLITVKIFFENPKYNYATSMNGNCSDKEIRQYFRVGMSLNVGNVTDDIQVIKRIEITR